MIGIALGDVRWGSNSPGFGAAWTPTHGFEGVAENRPRSESTEQVPLEVEAAVASRKTATGQMLRLVPPAGI